MLRLLLQAFVLAYLPGAVLFRLPGRSRAYRAGLAWEERTFWAVVLSLCSSMAIVLALALFGGYTFGRLLTLNVIATGLLVVGFRGRLLYESGGGRPGPAALIPAILIVLGMSLYFPPSEYVIGGKDPGTYLNEGVQIAHRGELVLHDETVAMVPPPFRDLFFPSHQVPWYYGIRFMGFFVANPEAGTVVGQFPHMFPASIAIGYGLNGLTGARQAVGVWTILGLLAFYFAIAEFLGRRVAAGAAVLCAVNVITTWFGRYPNSEVVMMALLFSALLAFNRAGQGGGRFFEVVAGLLLGSMLFLRYEVVLAFVTVGAAALLAPVAHARIGRAFGLAFATAAGLGFWYLLVPMQAYSAYPLAFTREHAPLVAAGAIVVALLVRALMRFDLARARLRRFLPPVVAILLIVLAAYAYFLREAGGRTALGDAMAFRAFGWYLGPWVLAAAVAGTAGLIAMRFWSAPAFMLTFTLVSVFFFYKMRIVPEHFWAARRFLAVSLPGVLAGLALFVEWALTMRPVRTLVTAAASGVAALVPAIPRARAESVLTSTTFGLLLLAPGWQFWQAAAPVRQHVEYAGLIARLEHLGAQVGPRDLLLVESRNAGSDVHVLAEPLAYIYSKQVLVLDSVVPPHDVMASFVEWAASRYDRILFLGGGGSDLLGRRLTATPLMADRFQVPEYDAQVNAYPLGVRHKEFEFGLYRLETSDDREAGPVAITIGDLDDLNVVRFQARERSSDGTPFRWTRAQSWIVLRGLSPQARELTLWMSSGGRPVSAPPAVVEVAVDDVVVGTATLADEFRPYAFPLPPASTAQPSAGGRVARVRLRTKTWNPRTMLGVPDTRDLGVMVAKLEAR